jgi:3'(2'), 5'-bisphosphate nucleotidase
MARVLPKIGISPIHFRSTGPTMHDAARDELAARFGALASEAGKLIMAIYSPTLKVEAKKDSSPVTEADAAAEHAILAGLQKVIPDVPVVAEESFDAKTNGSAPARFILVDPLDGTREFITGSHEFTVNIALVENSQPTVGCVYAPALNQMYLAGAGAWRAEVKPGEALPRLDVMQKLATSPYPAAGLRAMASRSHLDPETEALLKRLQVGTFQSAGSSLKFCVLAQGDGDIYPRLAPTMEWDTAAGQAVLTAAGGCVIGRDGSPFRYGKAGFRNDGFVAWGREPLP